MDSYRFKKDWKRAEESLRKALKKTPESGIAVVKPGLTLKVRGRTDEALRYYGNAIASKDISDATKRFARKEIADIMAAGKEK